MDTDEVSTQTPAPPSRIAHQEYPRREEDFGAIHVESNYHWHTPEEPPPYHNIDAPRGQRDAGR